MQNEINFDDEKITVTASKRMFNKGFRIVDNESDSESEYSDDTESEYSDRSDEEFDDNIEAWMDIKGYDNYMISSFGNVYNINTGKILKTMYNTKRYLYVGLSRQGKLKCFLIHRLVAAAFIDNPENKKCIDHIDNNRTNNHVSNLRYASHFENSRNKSKHKNNTSSVTGVTGVNCSKNAKKWRVRIMVDGKSKHLGYFKTLDEAKEARINAVNKFFGDFAHKSQKRI